MPRSLILIKNHKTFIFWCWASLVFLLLGSYVYLANQIIFEAVGREKILAELATRRTELGAMEAEYLNLSRAINLDLAYQLGFTDSSQVTTFVKIFDRTASRPSRER